MMRRVVSIFLLIAFAGLATGIVEQLHDRMHPHDESTCAIHATLHMPTSAPPIVAVLIAVGLFVAFLTQLSTAVIPQRVMVSRRTRGPPARFPSI